MDSLKENSKKGDENLTEVESELKDLAEEMIKVMKDYKEKGIITEEEYQKSTKKKREFLEYLSKKKSIY